MAKVTVSFTAQRDETNILRDLARKAGRAVAARYAADFDRLYARLGAYPDSGAPRPKLGKFARIGIVPPWLFIYDYDAADDAVVVLRAVHGQRRITARLLRR